MFPVRVKKLLIGAVIALTAMVVTVQVTDICGLEAVTLNGEPVEDYQGKLGLKAGALVTSQPLEEIADSLLSTDEVKKIDIEVELPGRVTIVTNRFEAAALVLSENTGKLYGLDQHGRVVPLVTDDFNWECPLLVNAGVSDLYEPCQDVRVTMILEQLEELSDENEDLYRLITEIDLDESDHIEISISGLTYELWATSSQLADQLTRFVRFVQNYDPELTDVTRIDLRFDDMIVCGA